MAQIIDFPAARAAAPSAELAPSWPPATILFFTGVRYERAEEAEPARAEAKSARQRRPRQPHGSRRRG